MPPEPAILAFDTSAAHCAAALVSGRRVLAQRSEPMDKGQAERLLPLLEEILSDADMGWHDLSALAVGIGPGNFTGVRISVAAARGLALALGVPAHGVSGFEALAFGLPRPCLASLDARQGKLYLQRFTDRSEPPMIVARDAMDDDLKMPGLTVVGHEAAALAANLGAGIAHQPLAAAVAIAHVATARSTPAPRPAPLYLRPADAAPPRDGPPPILP